MSNNPTKIIIHHSLTHDNIVLSDFEAIRKYHIETNKWKDIGYHFVIEYVNNKLTVREGRKMWEVGAHTVGQNAQSIGYCCVCNYDKLMPPQSLYNFIAKHIVDVVFKYYNDKMSIHGHREYSEKTCPGLNFDISRVEAAIKSYQASFIKTKVESFDKSLDEIYEECLNEPNKLKESIKYIKDIAAQNGDLGILEQMKFIEVAIKKFYYRNKNAY